MPWKRTYCLHMGITESEIINAVVKILTELIDGSSADAAWVLNRQDHGLISSLGRMSADKASAVPVAGGASIAAHVDHLRYGLELLNRWSRGEKPFDDADYSGSWDRLTVSEAEWKSRREALANEAYAWREALEHPSHPTGLDLTAVVASVAHLAYHLGAIRQIDRSTAGPPARD